jgi:hypothetical protein
MNKTTQNKFKRLAICGTTAALVALPLLTSGAKADPPSLAPAHGF